MIALDASALLAYLFREPGHEQVAAVLEESALLSVNLSEVISRFTRDGHDARFVLQRFSESPIELVPFTPADAALAAALRPQTARLGLSLGDRAYLALAISRGVPAVTAERSWRKLDVGIPVRLIR